MLITTAQNGNNPGVELEVSGEGDVSSDTATEIDSEYVGMGVDTSTEDSTEYAVYSYNGPNYYNTHRMIIVPGITMRSEFRPWVAWLPREYPGSCPVCLSPNEANLCENPCTWVPVNPSACSRYCDKRITEGYRKYCPMYNIFDYHEDATLFTFGHNRLGQGVICLLYTSPSPRDRQKSRMPSSA